MSKKTDKKINEILNTKDITKQLLHELVEIAHDEGKQQFAQQLLQHIKTLREFVLLTARGTALSDVLSQISSHFSSATQRKGRS